MMNPHEGTYNRLFDAVLSSMHMDAIYAGVRERGGEADFTTRRVHDFLREVFKPVHNEMARSFAEYTRTPLSDIVSIAVRKKGDADKTKLEGNVHAYIHDLIYWAASSVMIHEKWKETGGTEAGIGALIAGIKQLQREVSDPPTEEQARAIDAYKDQIANLLPEDHPL